MTRAPASLQRRAELLLVAGAQLGLGGFVARLAVRLREQMPYLDQGWIQLERPLEVGSGGLSAGAAAAKGDRADEDVGEHGLIVQRERAVAGCGRRRQAP